uniref:ACT domain-containing protein ACR n=1 Tax=Oryza brachyantha TaxID=4533 RepID=J3MUR5_ORYBR
MARCGELVEEEDDDEYAKLVRRMNPPSVVIDNDSCDSATVIRVDRVKKHGILLEAVQVLVDLNLVITKAYISSDGNWFMDVFNVTDQDGNKLQNTEVTDCIKKCLESEDYLVPPASGLDGGAAPSEETTCVELTGTDRPGLLSEVCAVLASLSCNIVNAEVWTHDRRAAAVIQHTDAAPGGTAVSLGAAHAERRLHRLMLDDADGDAGGEERSGGVAVKPKAKVVVMDCTERRYTVVILRCRDRPRLLFDTTLCALTDLHYVVFHGTVDAEGGSSKEAYQEYYVRHVDGHPVRCDAERLRLVRCLVAAVERRASDGLELEVKTEDRAGLLSEITRVFRENSLSIIRAVITTKDGEADDTFYVSDAYGNPVNGKAMETLGEQLGHAVLRVKSNSRAAIKRAEDGGGGAASIIGNLLKGSFQGFRLIRSYS